MAAAHCRPPLPVGLELPDPPPLRVPPAAGSRCIAFNAFPYVAAAAPAHTNTHTPVAAPGPLATHTHTCADHSDLPPSASASASAAGPLPGGLPARFRDCLPVASQHEAFAAARALSTGFHRVKAVAARHSRLCEYLDIVRCKRGPGRRRTHTTQRITRTLTRTLAHYTQSLSLTTLPHSRSPHSLPPSLPHLSIRTHRTEADAVAVLS